VRFEEIPIAEIRIGKSQTRIRKVKEPVTVYQKEDGKYELIAGQRRYLAIKDLGWKTTNAHVIGKPETLIDRK
jgi:ParB-like chromosome segregation protein Spo0J